MLSDSDSELSNDDSQQLLTINEHFAKAYQHKKEREELSKLKEKYGSDVDEDELGVEEDSEEDTTEDEDGEELTPAVDAAILRTLARIKRKDPDIYTAGRDVFEEEQNRSNGAFTFAAKKDKEKSKPLLMRQHILDSALKNDSRSPSPEPIEPTHAQEQTALRKETISAFHSAVDGKDSDEEGDEDDILIPREKTRDELEREQEDYRAYLQREVGGSLDSLIEIERSTNTMEEQGPPSQEDSVGETKKKNKKRKNMKSKEEEDHDFLMNYILNRGWVDKSSRHVPTFAEITGNENEEQPDEQGDIDGEEGQPVPALDEMDDEDFDEVAETFESSYNFRYEEPDAGKIQTFPRDIGTTVRRDENPRKAARERRKQRKEEELLQKREEVKRLKSLKMKEIREKLERIGKEGGMDADDEALAQLDLDADWDPDAHDKQMNGIYGFNTEEGDEEDFDEDVEKPTWDEDIDITDIIPVANPEAGPSSLKSQKKKKKRKHKEEDEEDDDIGVDLDDMDANILSKRPKSDKKALDSAMDDVYNLEFNDIVGGIATRFKYTPVLPQAYGLSATEILMAEDGDLNDVVGLKKLAPYRKDKGRMWDSKRGEKLGEFRAKLQNRHGKGLGKGTGTLDEEGETKVKKRKGKKERQRAKLEVGDDGTLPQENVSAVSPTGNTAEGEISKKKRKRKHRSSATD